MPKLDHLPVAGKEYKKSIFASSILHALLLLLIVSLAAYSAKRVEEMRQEKQEQAEQEKKEKIEDAVAEQQLEEDIKEVLEELQPDADAEELEELVQELEELIDKEELKDKLIAAMDEENEEQEEAQEEYFDQLEDELSEHFEDALEETEDDKLEQELIEELVYEDLPEIDNNIENALKRNTLDEIIRDTLAEKADDLANETNKQLSKEYKENGWDKERYKERGDIQKDLRKLKNELKNPTPGTEDLIKKVDEIAKHTENTLDYMKKKNPFTEKHNQTKNEKNKSKLEQAKENYNKAKTEKDAKDNAYQEAAKKALDTINKQVENNKDNALVKQRQKQIDQQSTHAENQLKKENNKSQHSLNAIQQTSNTAKQALKNKKEEHTAINNDLKKAQQAQREQAKAEQTEARAMHTLRNEAMRAHQTTVREAESYLKKLDKADSEKHKDTVNELKKAIAENKKASTPKDLKGVEAVEKKIAALETAKQEFSDKVNKDREKSLAETKKKLDAVKTLAKEIQALKDLTKLNTEEVAEIVKEESIKERINDKADYLRENLKNGTEEEKDQRKEDFKLNAKEAAAHAQSEGEKEGEGESESESESEEESLAESESEEEGEGETEGNNNKLSKSLSKALAEKMGLGEDFGPVTSQTKKKKGPGFSGGVEVDVDGLIKKRLMRPKFRMRKLSMAEKKTILSKNTVNAAPKEPPVLRFAKPTLVSEQTNMLQVSEDIYVGKLNKREVAKLDPNRPRKSHPKFQNTDFAAVPFCTKIPKLDGDPSDWNLEHTRLSPGKDVFMQWRPDGLYVLALIRDKSGQFETAERQKVIDNFWNFDCMEVWFDMKNSKAKKTAQHACQQFWLGPKLPGVRQTPEMWEVVWGKKGYNAQRNGEGKRYVGSQVHKDNKGYNLEYFIPRAHLTNLKFFRAGQVLGFLYVINHNSNYKLADSSLRKFNPSFHYSSQPSSWGNLQLLGTDAALNTLTAEGKPAEFPTVEVSQSLGLMVNDPDSNTDIGAVNAVTVRVRNRYGFDGRQKDEKGQPLGDWEDVRLQETGKNTGIFKGWVRTTLLPSTTGDDKIGVQPGDILDVDYNDYVRMAGEYDQKMHVEVQVVSPVYSVEGARKIAVKK